MNTLKIVSIFMFAIVTICILFFISRKMLVSKRENESSFEEVFQLSSIFIGISIIMNLVFQKLGYFYDLIDQYGVDFHPVFSVKGYEYGYSMEIVKISVMQIVISFVYLIVNIELSKTIAKNFYTNKEWQYAVFKSVIFICLLVSFYSVLNYILDNFYIVIDTPSIR